MEYSKPIPFSISKDFELKLGGGLDVNDLSPEVRTFLIKWQSNCQKEGKPVDWLTGE